MAFALVAIPALAYAPSTPQNSITIRPMDNYVVAYHVLPVLQKKPQTYKASAYPSTVALGAEIAITRGIEGEQWECLNVLWGVRESGWNSNAQNPTSTAYGIAQFLDSTWAGTGYKKSSDPEIQIRAGLVYIEKRYGTPCAALRHSLARNWY